MTGTPPPGDRPGFLPPWTALLAVALLPGVAGAQDFRGQAWATARTVEVRPIVQDTVARDQVEEIAKTKLPDLNTNDIEAAMRQIEGTARSMGLTVVD